MEHITLTTFHLCCLGKEITHCLQCSSLPCTGFKGFTKP